MVGGGAGGSVVTVAVSILHSDAFRCVAAARGTANVVVHPTTHSPHPHPHPHPLARSGPEVWFTVADDDGAIPAGGDVAAWCAANAAAAGGGGALSPPAGASPLAVGWHPTTKVPAFSLHACALPAAVAAVVAADGLQAAGGSGAAALLAFMCQALPSVGVVVSPAAWRAATVVSPPP